MRRLEHELNTPQYKAMHAFIGIYGVGPGIALEWFQRGLRNLDDVRQGKYGVVLSPAQQVRLLRFCLFPELTIVRPSALDWPALL